MPPAGRPPRKITQEERGLSKPERMFVANYYQTGKTNATEAYQRAFFPEVWNEDEGVWEDNPNLPSPRKKLHNAASALTLKPHIVAELERLDKTTQELAQDAIEDALKFGDAGEKARAADQAFKQMERMGRAEAAEIWAETLCAVGTDVVVDLEDGRSVRFPLKEMFPRYEDAMPSSDAIRKTMKTLDQMLYLQNNRSHVEMESYDDWNFMDGFNDVKHGS